MSPESIIRNLIFYDSIATVIIVCLGIYIDRIKNTTCRSTLLALFLGMLGLVIAILLPAKPKREPVALSENDLFPASATKPRPLRLVKIRDEDEQQDGAPMKRPPRCKAS
jgi:hypothetical protein